MTSFLILSVPIDCWIYVDSLYHGKAIAGKEYCVVLEAGTYQIKCVDCKKAGDSFIFALPVMGQKVMRRRVTRDQIYYNRLNAKYDRLCRNSLEYGVENITLDNKTCYISLQGKVYDDVCYCYDGRTITAVHFEHKWGFINQRGIEVIKPQYDNIDKDGVGSCIDGLIGVCLNNKWGFVDTKGQEIVKPQYDKIGNTRKNSLISVCLNGRWGFVNSIGQEIVKPMYDKVKCNGYGSVACACLNGKWGWVDAKGQEIAKPQYDEIGETSKNGVTSVCLNGKWGFVNAKGRTVIKPQYDKIGHTSNNGLVSVCLNGRWGFVNAKGQEVVPPQYDDVHVFSERMAAVCQNGQWGYLHESGQMVIEACFDSAKNFYGGVAEVFPYDGETVVINKCGEMVATIEDYYLGNYDQDIIDLGLDDDELENRSIGIWHNEEFCESEDDYSIDDFIDDVLEGQSNAYWNID